MTMKHPQKKTSGFTLVEMIIYIAFFAVLSVVTVNAVILVMKSFYSLRITQNISQSATTAMERMSHEIRNAYNVDTVNSTLSSSPGRLTLLSKDSMGANISIEFYVDAASQLGLKVNGVDKGSLLAKSVKVNNLVFRSIDGVNSKAVKIEMTLTDSRQDQVKVVKFYDTVVLRGSVH